MKTLALLGGMTYHATCIYYTEINKNIQLHFGGPTSASLLLHSFNHAETQKLFIAGDWRGVTEKFTVAAKNLKHAGAERLIICCNIGHKVAEEVEAGSGLPVLHIADATGNWINKRGIRNIALLGTKPVMEDAFFAGRLVEKFDLQILVPSEDQRDMLQGMIMGDLARNVVTLSTKKTLLEIIDGLVSRGAEAVVFACTELQFAVKPEDISVPLLDTMGAHIEEASSWLLSE